MPTYTGNNGSNTINGSNGDDTISGLGGDDTLSGGNGDDTISGGSGQDQIYGGNGNDIIDGGTGDDVLDGGNGDDAINGGDDNDIIYGGNGVDTLNGGSGNDELYGQNGDDKLTGGGGDDLLDGNNGFDIAYFSGPIGEYSFYAAAGYLHVVHLGGAGADGHDRLIRIERLVFADRVINLGSGNNKPVAVDDHVFINEDTGTYSSGAASVKDNDFDFDGDTLTVTGGTFVGTYGTLTLNANGTYSYTLNASTQALAQGQNVTDSFNYTVTDNDGSDTGALVFHIAGVNDGPTANADSASTSENATILVNVLANDTDIDNGAVLTVTAASAPVGQGSASVVGNQVQFNPGTDFDDLAVGQTEVVVVSYSISDEHGATSSSNLTITVTGTNDAPVANPDTATTSENATILVDVLANDTDVDNGAVLTVTAASAPVGQGSASVVSNQVQFNPGTDFDDLAVGQTEVVVVSYSIQDQFGASSSSTLTITVTGTNDGPVANPDTDTTSENAVLLVDVLANDTDVDNGAVLTLTAASAPAGQGSASVVGNQVQFDPGSDFDYLAVGESTAVVVSYSIQDEHGASSSSTITVTVNGANDAPTIDAGGTDATGSVTELPNNDPNENAFTHTDSGAVAFDDVDLSDTHTASFTPQGGGYLGTFTLDPVDQLGDSVGWDFSVDDSDLDFLDDGETLTQTYTIEIDDGHGGTATQDVTITLTGAADGPQTEWYIDNSAVGSANLGTQADPFTSMAAFNAAQGTLTGPQVGATVYLLAGTGTYAETDGLNLLDDQIVVGVAAGPLRPTIVTTGGDGINVAQNNTISGLDVGNTTGADIADSGGSVGTLTIFDVGTSGTGQVIDVDQGGTLNVTLNSAGSTGSTGGAIDLAGVGGSFSVTGATAITGVHSGGGVDITGSSVAASFGGGGLVSTGTATAVNFVGNTGSLALGGGLAIVTTGGAGLNASGGGSMIATGGGNSVSSTTGIAVSISGTTIGGAGATFDSVSSSGAASGIVLANTGAGGFTVTGTGTAGSGGAIIASTGAGVNLTNTGPVSLTDFAITGGGDDGLRGTGVNGLDLLRTDVSNNGNAAGERGLDLVNLSGISGIVDSTFTGNATDGISIVNTTGTLDLTMTGSTVGNALGALANDGVNIGGNGSSTIRASITDSIFVNNRGDHFQFATDSAATSTSHITFNDNTLTTTSAAVLGGGVAIGTNGAADLFFEVAGNDIQGARITAISSSSTSPTAAGEMHGSITNNVIGTSGVVGSGSQTGNGINVTSNGNGTTTILVEDNTIHQFSSNGINVLARDGAGTLNMTIDGNFIREPGTFATNSIRVEAGALTTDAAQIWLEMNNNDVDTALAQDIRVRPRFDSDILMPGYSGAANDTVAVDAFLTAKNPLGGDIVALFASNVGSGFFDTPGSALVPLPTAPDLPLI